MPTETVVLPHQTGPSCDIGAFSLLFVQWCRDQFPSVLCFLFAKQTIVDGFSLFLFFLFQGKRLSVFKIFTADRCWGRRQRYWTCCSIEPAQPMHTIGVIYRSVLALQLGTRTSFLIFFSIIIFLQVFDLPHHIQYKFLFFGYGLSFFSITGFFFFIFHGHLQNRWMQYQAADTSDDNDATYHSAVQQQLQHPMDESKRSVHHKLLLTIFLRKTHHVAQTTAICSKVCESSFVRHTTRTHTHTSILYTDVQVLKHPNLRGISLVLSYGTPIKLVFGDRLKSANGPTY